MALVDYKKYQVLINSDSKKTQGLQAGDIIRRQYFDGADTIYSLMCVLSSGIEQTINSETGVTERHPYFVGALLEGNALDSTNKNEILDFARITNLFNINRSGALYLTASDNEAPFLDVIDGIGKSKSLSWPEALELEGFSDPQSQYVIKSAGNLNSTYTETLEDNNRVLSVTRTAVAEDDFEGLKQNFYQFVRNGEKVLISYKIRAREGVSLKASLGYTDDLHKDAEWTENITTDWEYKFRVVTVEYSGRHLRSFKLDMSALGLNATIDIADFNIILLSSVANFGDSSVTRVGKLEGVTDGVFGQLTGYGAYLQKLYASRSAHISGTLTAGDENGFGATFYAGKIHRNCFVNSLSPNFTHDVHIEGSDSEVSNPTGIGSVYRSSTALQMTAQTNEWMLENDGNGYCFSFWVYTKQPVKFSVAQNDKAVGEISIASDQTYEWRRVHTCFDIIKSTTTGEPMYIALTPVFAQSEYESAGDTDASAETFYFSAPQLESGNYITQYQATDNMLNPTTEYGAWFNRGGIGGTMQNPLLQLNFKDDEGNEGGIGTRSKSLLLRQDGSGYIANKNIAWDENGKVLFGSGVTLNWNNLDEDTQAEIANRYCHITGEDIFTVTGTDTDINIEPSNIVLTLEEIGFSSTSEQRQWMYKSGDSWIKIDDANSKDLTVLPDSDLWGIEDSAASGESSLTVKCVVTLDSSHVYTDTKTIRKQYFQGYTVSIESSKGDVFKNGECKTTLTANVYYNGILLDEEYIKNNFSFVWHRYNASDMSELALTDGVADINKLALDYILDEREIYMCEVSTEEVWPTLTFTEGSVTTTIASPQFELSVSGLAEVGTIITAGAVNILSPVQYAVKNRQLSGIMYGYSTSNNSTKESSDSVMEIAPSSISSSGSYALSRTINGVSNGSAGSNKYTAVGLSSVSFTAIEGENVVTVKNTGAKYIASFPEITEIYPCSNFGKTSEEHKNESIAADSVKSERPKNSMSKSFRGVYPVYATTDAIGTLSKQPLQDSSTYQLALVAETNSEKQKFAIFSGKAVSNIQILNTLSGQYVDYAISNFVTSVSELKCGDETKNFVVYTRNDGKNGITTFKITLR